MNKRSDERILRESIREIIIQESFWDDIWGGVKKGAEKAYDTISAAVSPGPGRSGFFKSLSDMMQNDDPYDFFDNDKEAEAQEAADEETDTGSSYSSSPVQGVTTSDGVVWSDETRNFVERLRQSIDPSIPLHITSAVRTPETQARAMLKKLELGGPEEIKKVYGRKSKFFLNTPPDVQSWTNVIEDLQSKGMGFKSGHLQGNAIDVRTRNLSSDQINNIITIAEQLGGKTLLETAPPHLHIDSF